MLGTAHGGGESVTSRELRTSRGCLSFLNGNIFPSHVLIFWNGCVSTLVHSNVLFAVHERTASTLLRLPRLFYANKKRWLNQNRLTSLPEQVFRNNQALGVM